MTQVATVSGNHKPSGCGSPGNHMVASTSNPLSCNCWLISFQMVSMRPLISIHADSSVSGLMGTTHMGVTNACIRSIGLAPSPYMSSVSQPTKLKSSDVMSLTSSHSRICNRKACSMIKVAITVRPGPIPNHSPGSCMNMGKNGFGQQRIRSSHVLSPTSSHWTLCTPFFIWS